MSDVIFGIGGDNTELKRSNDEAAQLIDSWVQRTRDAIDSIDTDLDFTIDTDALKSVIASILEAGSELEKGVITVEQFDEKMAELENGTNEAALAFRALTEEALKLAPAAASYEVVLDGINAKQSSTVKGAKELVEELKAASSPASKIGEIIDAYNARQESAAGFEKLNDDLSTSSENAAKVGDAIDSWNQSQENARNLAEDTVKNFRQKLATALKLKVVLVGVAGVIATALKTTESLTRKWSGYNEQLSESKRLVSEISDISQGIRAGDIERLVQAGDRDAIKAQFKQAIEDLGKLREAQKKAKEEFDTSGIIGNATEDSAFSFISVIKDKLEESNRLLAAQKQKVEALRAAFGDLADRKAKEAEQEKRNADELKARRDKEASDAAQRSANQKSAIEERIKLLELEARVASGDEGAQEEIDRIKANGSTQNPEQADAVVSAEAALRAAKKAADDRKQSQRDQEKFQSDTMRHEERLAAQRERNDEQSLKRREQEGKLIARQDRERGDANRPIGGIDASLQGAISRIQQSASQPDDRKELQRRHLEQLTEFRKESKAIAERQAKALDKIAAKEPTQAGGLL